MKAYRVWDMDSYYYCCTIVFAEKASEARKLARCTYCCENAEYIRIRAVREPKADALYNGKFEIDWNDKHTMVFLVKELGWFCIEPNFECDSCEAKPWCYWNGHWEE